MIGLACLAFATAWVAWWPADPSGRAAAWLTGPATSKRRVVSAGSLLPLLVAAGVIVATAVVTPQAVVWLVPALVCFCTVGW